MVIVNPDDNEKVKCINDELYSVLRADQSAHIVRDHKTSITSCAAFEKTAVDETIISLTPSLLIYSLKDNELDLSVSNPDLALYEGAADEVYDSNGKRKERSVYGRSWINNPSAPVTIDIEIKGYWDVADSNNIDVKYGEGTTILHITTRECKSEKINLKRK